MQPSVPAQAPDIVTLRTQRAGITFNFRGCIPDAQGDPIGELLDVDLVVPPLNFASMVKLKDRLLTLSSAPHTEGMATVVDALGQALARNYRHVPAWLVEQSVDVANMSDMVAALLDVDGGKRKEIEAGSAPAASDPTLRES